ncbi:MAG TPA: LysR family transcriptional regulator [Casimicrobiaceae bacterium]|nr:LysR family transcriptional regulator [Casimicrobiaceae bacterium]
MQPELRDLRAFLAVADQGSANRAGAALFRAQSAVSRSIRKLEGGLGIALFERRTRGMLLTEYGRALLVRALRVRAEMQRARTDLGAQADKGSVRNAPIFGMLVPERRIRTFVGLAEQHHMPSVARSLGITQPAVSITVRQLEDSVGVALFERTARGMIPTPAGAALALRLKRALSEIRDAVADIAALRGITQGTVMVGALPLGRTRLLPECIASVVGSYPGLRIGTLEGAFEALAASLRAGDLDFILGALRPADFATDLHGEPLVDDQLAIVSRREHPWAQRRRIRPDDLARARWVLPRPHTPSRSLFESALAKRGVAAPDVVVETSDLAVLRGVLLSSDLLTAISPHQLAYELETGLLTLLPVPLPDTRRVIGITRRRDGLPSPGARILMQEITRRCPAVLSAADRSPSGGPRALRSAHAGSMP